MALIYPAYTGVEREMGLYLCFHMRRGAWRRSPQALSLRVAFRVESAARFNVTILYTALYLEPVKWLFSQSPASPGNGVGLIGCVWASIGSFSSICAAYGVMYM